MLYSYCIVYVYVNIVLKVGKISPPGCVEAENIIMLCSRIISYIGWKCDR